jgi:lipoic acid synthetase
VSDPVQRKPEWLRIRLNTTPSYAFLKRLVREEGLHTVCEEARCPNLQECWGRHRTASFMILGDTCTRRCRFCAVKTGLPRAVDRQEPERVALAVKRMSLQHAHITMVNRDDLPDGGASLMAATVRAVREANPGCSIEVLCSDFLGDPAAIQLVVESRPDILSHNLETVRRLTPLVRSRSEYDRSLAFLRRVRETDPAAVTKSSLMLGLGESLEEVVQAMGDLREVGTDMLNLGQYLQPGRTQLPVVRYWTPEEFARLRELAFRLGFRHCESGPLVRSSYHAAQQLQDLRRAAAGA